MSLRCEVADIVRFERSGLLDKIQQELQDDLGVNPRDRIVKYNDYKLFCSDDDPGKSIIRSRVLRDWGIFIANAVVKDTQEVSGEIERAAEAFAKKKAEQAGRLVEAQTSRNQAILEAEGKAAAIEKVAVAEADRIKKIAGADAERIKVVAAADQVAAVSRITGFSIGEQPDEAGRDAFLRWFATEAYRTGLTTEGRTVYLQLPAQFTPFAPLFEELRQLGERDPKDLAAKLKKVVGGAESPPTS